MINIAICDDNLDTTLTMQKILENEIIRQDVNAKIILATNKQEEIINLIKSKSIDILILDVEFENSTLNGIEFAKILRKYNKEFYLVFLSAYQRFLYPSLVTKIFDYLVKPTNIDNVRELVTRIKEEFDNTNNRFIQINKWQQVRIDDIIYMEKSVNKTIIHTKAENFVSSKTLDKIIDMLPDNFSRCYRSYIVNKDKIISINRKDNTITLQNDFTCPINSKFCI